MSIDSVLDRLRPVAQDIEKRTLEDESSYWVLTFPASPEADYRFRAYVYDDGDASISADRTGAGSNEYFWGIVFEMLHDETPDENWDYLVDTVLRLLSYKTRIIQSVGWINVVFDCEYADHEGWHSVGGNAALRFSNFEIPKIDGKEKEYRAPAVRPGKAQ